MEDKKKFNWLEDEQETIMIFGLPKHGKTFAYCSYIDYIIKVKQGNVFIISTDSGFIRTVKAYFGDRIKDVYDKIEVESVFDINSIRNYYNSIKDRLKKNDLLVIDLISDVWEWAQINFVEQMASDDIQNFIIKASKDTKMFGLFDSNKWSYVKALHKFVEDIIVKKTCNFIGVCNEKDVEVELKRDLVKTKKLMTQIGFSDLACRPGGMKLLPHKFNTIIRIGINNNNKRFFQIVGDRGYDLDLSYHYYEKNMYKKLLSVRSDKNGMGKS